MTTRHRYAVEEEGRRTFIYADDLLYPRALVMHGVPDTEGNWIEARIWSVLIIPSGPSESDQLHYGGVANTKEEAIKVAKRALRKYLPELTFLQKLARAGRKKGK